MPSVSVIMPVYNAEKYLNTSITSLVNQTLEDIEIIVVNDGSNDSSQHIIESFVYDFPDKIRLINKKNGGQASARNLGIESATGKYIAFLDADDYVDIHMYQKLYNQAEATNATVTECGYKFIRYVNGEEVELTPYCKTRAFHNKKDMFMDPLVSPWNKLYKADFLKNVKIMFPEGCIYEDTAFYIKLIPFIESHSYLDEALIYHIFWESSTMNIHRDKKVGDIFHVLDDIIDFYKTGELWNVYSQEIEYFCTKILLNSSLGRVFLIRHRDLRRSLINQTFAFLRKNFPMYRKNVYIQKNKKGLYMKRINTWNAPIIGLIYRLVKRNGYFIG